MFTFRCSITLSLFGPNCYLLFANVVWRAHLCSMKHSRPITSSECRMNRACARVFTSFHANLMFWNFSNASFLSKWEHALAPKKKEGKKPKRRNFIVRRQRQSSKHLQSTKFLPCKLVDRTTIRSETYKFTYTNLNQPSLNQTSEC